MVKRLVADRAVKRSTSRRHNPDKYLFQSPMKDAAKGFIKQTGHSQQLVQELIDRKAISMETGIPTNFRAMP
jgi:hypothetical protein